MSDRTILMAEDDENDVEFMRRAFAQAEVTSNLHITSDGQAAVDYLAGLNGFGDRSKYPLPSIVMLDLKMPRKTGMDVLIWLRSQETFRRLPTIICSSSVHPAEIAAAYDAGANAFVTKPTNASERVELARLIRGFWLRFNQLA